MSRVAYIYERQMIKKRLRELEESGTKITYDIVVQVTKDVEAKIEEIQGTPSQDREFEE